MPADSTIDCTGTPEFAVATAIDACGSEFTLTSVDNTVTGSCAGSFAVTRTWTATDACGNSASASQTINVQDITAPVISALPADSTIECPLTPEFAIATAIDACGSDFTLTSVDNTVVGTGQTLYTIIRTWTATDACGNSSSAIQSITATDSTNPDIPVLSPIIAVCSITVPAPTTSDNCSGTLTATTTDPTTYSPGTYIIHWIFDDGNNNIINVNQDVTVNPSATILLNNADANCNNDIDIKFDLNSYLPSTVPSGGTWTDVDNSNGLMGTDFHPYLVDVGDYIFKYEVANSAGCTTTVELTMTVDDDCPVLPCGIIYPINAVTPNVDQTNDFFYIENIDEFTCYPTNSVEIYNRWGVLVYETKQYNNTDRAFRGISEGRVTVNKSAELPTGTYFYIINYTDSLGISKEPKQGYLYLSR